jgi:bacteriorhodopsin
VLWFLFLAAVCSLFEGRSHRSNITCCDVQTVICANNVLTGLLRVRRSAPIECLKYIEWSCAAPLMILQACVIANAPSDRTSRTVLYTVFFCVCGILAAYTPFVSFKITFVLLGMAACMAVLKRIVRDSLRQPGVPPTAKLQVLATVVVWPLYTVGWVLGPHCLNRIDAATEDHINMTLSLVLKTLNMHILVIPSERVVVWELKAL